jgi:hypothetical protein
MKRFLLITFFLVSIMLLTELCYGWDWDNEILNLHTVEVIVPGSIESDHSYHCKPVCMNQQNGGEGWQVGYFFHMSFTNSFGDPGWWDGMEIPVIKARNKWIRGELSILAGLVGGYTPKPIIMAWWKSEVGVNLISVFSAGTIDPHGVGYLNYNFTGFKNSEAQVSICWWSLAVYDIKF